MKFLTAITSPLILLSPLSTSAFDAQAVFQECVKSNVIDLESNLTTRCKVGQGESLPGDRQDLNIIKNLLDRPDNDFTEIQMGYDS